MGVARRPGGPPGSATRDLSLPAVISRTHMWSGLASDTTTHGPGQATALSRQEVPQAAPSHSWGYRQQGDGRVQLPGQCPALCSHSSAGCQLRGQLGVERRTSLDCGPLPQPGGHAGSVWPGILLSGKRKFELRLLQVIPISRLKWAPHLGRPEIGLPTPQASDLRHLIQGLTSLMYLLY